MTLRPILLYGAYGYTGRLIAREAKDRGVPMILSGRNRQKLETMASETGFPYRSADVGDSDTLRSVMDDVSVVLNAAGPFADTFDQVVGACLDRGCHYLDVTGEIALFERAANLDEAARDGGIVLMPGVGMDVVPSDCLAAHVAGRLPSANRLEIAFYSTGRPSSGTLRTGLRRLGALGTVRRSGRLVSEPVGSRMRSVDFGIAKRPAFSIPWGDVSTAYHSTRIPDITAYMAAGGRARSMLRVARTLGPLLRTALVRRPLQVYLDHWYKNPTSDERAACSVHFWAEVSNPEGRTRTARLHTPEGYTLTARTAVECARRVMNGQMTPGFQTPATAFGPDFILDIAGCTREDLT